MDLVMSGKTSKNMLLMICIDIFLAAVTVFFAILYRQINQARLLTLYVTFLTISYHFIMRLIVGESVTAIYKNRKFNLNSRGFRMYKFESELYKRLRVKKWKSRVITAKPEQFDISKNNLEVLLHNIMQAELVHRIIMILSFVPLLLIIPYGEPTVFIVTSFISCLADLQFVIVQRYNRPRVIKLMKNDKIQRGGILQL